MDDLEESNVVYQAKGIENLDEAVEVPNVEATSEEGKAKSLPRTIEDSQSTEIYFRKSDASVDQTGNQQEIHILKQTNAVQLEHLQRLQKELNEAHVKHGEEIYWVRLELDSSRLEKEAVEDRLAELYRDVQEMMEAKNRTESHVNSETAGDVCTEPDYVLGLESRIEAFERTVDLINRQMAMLRTSSDAVVTSLKQEVSDLMEEKSRMEMDLLNQISILDNDKRFLEIRVSESLDRDNNAMTYQKKEDNSEVTPIHLDAATPSWSCSQSSMAPMEKEAADVDITDAPPDLNRRTEESFEQNLASKTANDERPETSFRSTATTQGSSFVQEKFSSQYSASLVSTDDSWLHVQNQVEHDQHEALTWKAEVEALKNENAGLQQKVDEVTKELLFTRSSANTALALDKIRTDREETQANLDRVSTLWDRADQTIQVLEILLSEVQGGPAKGQVGLDSEITDREKILTALETAAIVHGQVKMTLMQAELTFRNHLACIQNDDALQQLQHKEHHDATIEKLQHIRRETLTTISEAEARFSEQINQIKEQATSEATSLQYRLHSQLNELEQTKTTHESLESEIAKLKQQLAEQSDIVAPQKDTGAVIENPFEKGETVSERSPNSLVVSHSVMAKLQKEVFSVVERVQEKNDTIDQLTAAIAKHKTREEVLKKELQRAQQRPHGVSTAKGKATSRSKLDLGNLNRSKGDACCKKTDFGGKQVSEATQPKPLKSTLKKQVKQKTETGKERLKSEKRGAVKVAREYVSNSGASENDVASNVQGSELGWSSF